MSHFIHVTGISSTTFLLDLAERRGLTFFNDCSVICWGTDCWQI